MAQRDLDEHWDQLVAAVREEFSRHGQDPAAVFVPVRDRLRLLAWLDRPGEDADWMSISVTPAQLNAFSIDGTAREFVALYQQERRQPP